MYEKIPNLYEIVVEKESENKKQKTFSRYKVCIATSGSGVWKINDRQVLVSEGDVFFMSNTDLRCFTHINEPICMIVCEIEPLHLEKIFVSLFKNRPTELPRSFSYKNSPKFISYMKDALRETKEKKSYSEFCIKNAVNMALTEALRKFTKEIKKNEKEIRKEVVYALEYAEKHLSEDFTLEEIAKEQNISASALCKQFSKSVGIGYSRYISQKRTEEVIKIITENKEINILDAAFSAGFKNSAAFYETFKRITGTTPKNIRKNPYYNL